VESITFECRVGGSIVEELVDGRRYQWGKVLAFDPPRSVSFSWHPSQAEELAQQVEVTFVAESGGTRVELVSTGWERLGARARRARKGYDIGWGAVLDTFVGRKTFPIVLFAIISRAVTFVLRVTGRLERAIDGAGGRLPPRAR